MKLNRVLWIDDEYDQLQDVINDARNEGILLAPYKSLREGMAELHDNYQLYDAILLDAKFYARENDVAGTEDTQYVFEAQRQIQKLAAKKEFEIFILSGQAEDPTTIDNSFRKSFPNFYHKGDNEESDKLWRDLNSAIDRQPIVQLRREYSSVFAVCDDKYVNRDLEINLIDLLSDYKKDGLNVDHLNAMRKIVEHLGEAIVAYGFVPDELDSINNISRVLRGDVTSKDRQASRKYQLEHKSFPNEVGWLMSSLVQTVQSGSHALYLDAHLRTSNSKFWIQAAFFELLALLEWFKAYVDSGDRPRYNKVQGR